MDYKHARDKSADVLPVESEAVPSQQPASVLSPILFIIYTADCKPLSVAVLQIKFDDTTPSGFLQTNEVTYRSAVDELLQWCDQSLLELNVTKTTS